MPEWMWMPHELPAVPAPLLHAGSAPVRSHENVCVVPDVVIGPTLPPTELRFPA